LNKAEQVLRVWPSFSACNSENQAQDGKFMEMQFLIRLALKTNKKSQTEGFTLIELLVVVIIVGILATVALPNFLGQIGKARETEFKNAVGTINRAQIAYHWERRTFADGEDALQLSVVPGSNLDNVVFSGPSTTIVTITTQNIEASQDGTRAYSGATTYDPNTSNYTTIVCQTNNIAANGLVPTGSGAALSCPSGSERLQ
jgi:type IV pilus assembly protein PilA